MNSDPPTHQPGSPIAPATVFVVDDDQQVRTAIEQLASSVGLKVRAFASAVDFLDNCDPSAPGCLVTDVRMPEMSGLELQTALLQTRIRLPVIVMTGYAEVLTAVKAFRDGAFDFVQKPFSPQALLETIQRAIHADGEQRIRRRQAEETRQRIDTLSPRETEVLSHLVAGRTTKAIAKSLDISLTTVDFHRNNVLNKMKVDNVVELTRIVAEFEVRQEEDQ